MGNPSENNVLSVMHSGIETVDGRKSFQVKCGQAGVMEQKKTDSRERETERARET